eukprot:scaffold129_cov254-Pinguiococcus_pyrenoidosus.AAC.3
MVSSCGHGIGAPSLNYSGFAPVDVLLNFSRHQASTDAFYVRGNRKKLRNTSSPPSPLSESVSVQRSPGRPGSYHHCSCLSHMRRPSRASRPSLPTDPFRGCCSRRSRAAAAEP